MPPAAAARLFRFRHYQAAVFRFLSPPFADSYAITHFFTLLPAAATPISHRRRQPCRCRHELMPPPAFSADLYAGAGRFQLLILRRRLRQMADRLITPQLPPPAADYAIRRHLY